MDQMASVGVEFYPPSALRMISQQVRQYEAKAAQQATASTTRKAPPQWAVDTIFRANAPIRPWATGAILKPPSVVDWITGRTTRTPGQYRRVDPVTGDDRSGPFLLDTNERIHSSARVRLACRGLAVNDQGEWTAPTLARRWRLRRTTAQYADPVPRDPLWDPANHAQVVAQQQQQQQQPITGGGGRKPNEEAGGERWVWEHVGPEEDAPADARQRVLVEEPLGPYERFLLNQTGGTPNVYVFAEGEELGSVMAGSGKQGREQDSGTETDMPGAK